MPETRDDGRHWCSPTLEDSGGKDHWWCPECGQEWTRMKVAGLFSWVRDEEVEAIAALAADAPEPDDESE